MCFRLNFDSDWTGSNISLTLIMLQDHLGLYFISKPRRGKGKSGNRKVT